MNTMTDTSSVDAITDVVGVKIGHFTDSRKPTGCTVLLTEEGAVGAVDVRGAAPGTRETDLLNPVNLVEKVHAIVLSGGSAFGLDTAAGVMRYLEERNIGFDVGVARVPIVPAAILFDLAVGDPKIRPNAEAGYQACINASVSRPAQGNFGAGAGATVGKCFGIKRAMKGELPQKTTRRPSRQPWSLSRICAAPKVTTPGKVQPSMGSTRSMAPGARMSASKG